MKRDEEEGDEVNGEVDEDDFGVNEDSNESQSVRASNKEDIQRTTTLTDNKKRETTKTKDLQSI